ncbi:hypothetical protein EV360DRAFT_6167, partial [Lentinula raphanica]
SEPFFSRYMPSLIPGTPPQIRNNPRLYPFFQHAVGAIDGSHIPVHVVDSVAARFRNRK